MRQLTAVASLVLLASGCATYSWQRPGTPPAIAAQDHAECNALARDSARDIALSSFPYWWGPRFYGPAGPWPHAVWWRGWDPFWDPYWGPPGDPAWRRNVERQILQNCMRSRGYDLYREPKA